MDIDIWNNRTGKYIHEHRVKYIFNASNYFKLRYTDNTEKKFDADNFKLEFVFSDNWKKEAIPWL